ncbi:MAG TPA: LPS export ABC transporter periplasmic protein LptC [Puia sp.]
MNSINRFIILFLVTGVFFARCGDKAKVVKDNTRRQLVPEEVTGVESYMSEGDNVGGKLSAKVKGKLTAPYMLRYNRPDSPYTEFPRSLHVDFYKVDSNAKSDAVPVIESKMDALYGKYFQNQEKVFLRDSVVVKNILKGDTVHCRELWWDQNTGKFYTDKPVRIYTKDKILYGTGMEADQNFRWYTITKLTGTVLTAESGMPK